MPKVLLGNRAHKAQQGKLDYLVLLERKVREAHQDCREDMEKLALLVNLVYVAAEVPLDNRVHQEKRETVELLAHRAHELTETH